ncbi:MAG: hypothetical protein ACE5IY_08430 [bacterium]
MKSLLSLLSLWPLFFLACENPVQPTDPPARAAQSHSGDLGVTFFLADSSGNEQTTFGFRQDISFHYAIANESGQRLPYTVPDTGPIVLNVHEYPEHPPARILQAKYCFGG